MKGSSVRTRLDSLDGIRGLAILAVLLNHIPYVLPLSGILGSIVFGSGVLGVSFLFVLSGFLMAFIYSEPKGNLWFLQKRYTRIFPLFLTMSLVTLLFRVFPSLIGLWGIVLILGLAGIVHLIWVYIVKKLPSKFGKSLFIFFLLIQAFTFFLYAVVVMRFPPIVFNQQISPVLREGTIGLVNSTLTLPFGTYIPMLDGVYWSLAAEVLFYLLYPTICVPVINYLKGKKRSIKYLFLLSLMPLFAGFDLLSKKILGLSMLQLPLFYCFVTGMTLGYLYKNKKEVILKATNFLNGEKNILSILLFLAIIILYHLVLDTLTPWNTWSHILFAIPLAFIITMALNPKNSLSKLLSSKALVFLGTISYSIYLSHSPLIHIVEKIFTPTSIFFSAVFIAASITLTLLISKILYVFLEKPYFIKRKEDVVEKIIKPSRYVRPAFVSLSLISLIYLISIFNAYQSNFNFFSIEYPAGKNAFLLATKSNLVPVSPLLNMEIRSEENNLGIITMHLIHEASSVNTKKFLSLELRKRVRANGTVFQATN